jgi:hypothetical protein
MGEKKDMVVIIGPAWSRSMIWCAYLVVFEGMVSIVLKTGPDRRLNRKKPEPVPSPVY